MLTGGPLEAVVRMADGEGVGELPAGAYGFGKERGVDGL